MRMEVHVHAEIPVVEGVTRQQIEQALQPWLAYLEVETLADAKSLEPDEPGLEYDESARSLLICWTGEIGRSFQQVLEAALEAVGPFAEEAAEVDVTLYHEGGEQESVLLFVGPNAQAIHEAQRRCMLDDVSGMLARQFGKTQIEPIIGMINELFDRDWKEKIAQPAKSERAFETYSRAPGRRHLH